jgi:ubiquinone/menaquinone biosynthesis C-methylase UbiE
MTAKPHGAGKSAYDLIDADVFFDRIGWRDGLVLCDLGCGRGTFALALARRAGPSAVIYAVDLWEEGISDLRKAVAEGGLSQIHPMVADIGRAVPVDDNTADMALMATVFHDLPAEGGRTGALAEVKRILKPKGRLAMIEFKKQDGPPGPPAASRISSTELDRTLVAHDFHPVDHVDLGPHIYMNMYAL